MKDALDLRSKSGIHRLITALEERGFIRRLPNRARAIEVIKLPELSASGAGNGRRGFTPSVIEGTLGKVAAAAVPRMTASVRSSVPVMGRIAAGTPIEALQTRSHTISVPPDMLGSGEHYALEVRGDSMVDAGILDGDMALIQRNESAETGDIVVALIDEEEATLKRFRRRGASIALEPANASYEVRILPPNRVQDPGQADRAVPEVLRALLDRHSGMVRQDRATEVVEVPALRVFDAAGACTGVQPLASGDQRRGAALHRSPSRQIQPLPCSRHQGRLH